MGAGFIRNAVWDHLHRRPPSRQFGDVDVIWFSAERTQHAEDALLEAALRALDSLIVWSVKNQARMHLRNGDAPYGSAVQAMRGWPETATAVAARYAAQGACEFAAPFGLDDLFNLTLRPTRRFAAEKHQAYLDRIQSKGWLTAWPLLRVVG